MLLIGSHALRYRGIDTGRKPLDIDVIATFDELGRLTRALRHRTTVMSIPLSANKTVLKCGDGTIVEVEIAWSDSPAAELCPVHDKFPYTDGTTAPEELWGFDRNWGPKELPITKVATLDLLYTIKMSHRYLKNSPHFRKTRDDIILMRKNGAKVVDEAWLKRREDETYWYKHPKLNVEKKDFFGGDGVLYVYDHDTVHQSMAHVRMPTSFSGDFVPAYTLYMKDGAAVQCSKEKFFAVDESIRLNGVLEEAQVLALERSQIPFRGKVEPRRSFDMALMKVCTSITSGWFREFAWENFDRVEAMYEPDYVDRFWKAVDDGIVRKLEPGEIPTYK